MCQCLRRNKSNFGKLLAQHVEIQLWDLLCIDLIGEYGLTPNKEYRKYAMKGKKDKDILCKQ